MAASSWQRPARCRYPHAAVALHRRGWRAKGSSQLVGQQGLRALQRAPHPALHRAKRPADMLRDLTVAHAAVVRQAEAFTLCRRQRAQALLYGGVEPALAQHLAGTGFWASQARVDIVCFVAGGRVAARRSAAAPFQAVDGAVARDARQPLLGLTTRRVKVPALAPNLDVSLLQQFFGLAAVAVDAQDDRQQTAMAALVAARAGGGGQVRCSARRPLPCTRR